MRKANLKLVKQVELHPDIFSSQRGGILMSYGLAETPSHPLLRSASLNSLINLDRPHHTALRMEHMQFFRPGFVAELRKRVEVQVSDLLDEMQRRGPKLDMVETFSAELPLFTLSEILGVPAADRPKLVHWMHFLENSQYQAQQEGLGNISMELKRKLQWDPQSESFNDDEANRLRSRTVRTDWKKG